MRPLRTKHSNTAASTPRHQRCSRPHGAGSPLIANMQRRVHSDLGCLSGRCSSCCRPIIARRHRRNMSNELCISRFVPRCDWCRRNWCPSTMADEWHAVSHTMMRMMMMLQGRDDTDRRRETSSSVCSSTSVRVANAACAADESATVGERVCAWEGARVMKGGRTGVRTKLLLGRPSPLQRGAPSVSSDCGESISGHFTGLRRL